MRWSTSIVASLVASLAFVLSVGACTESGDSPVGSLDIPLQQVGGDGALYHLSAVFQIDGPGGSQIVDAVDFRSSVTLELPPGPTSITLIDGWTLERSTDFGATFSPVSAVLGTINPLGVRMTANFSTSVVFEFLVRNPNGQLAISFGVTLHPRELAGGVTVTTGTGDYAGYTDTRFDFANYHKLGALDRITLVDGTKMLQFTADATAIEFFNDPIGTLAGPVAASMMGARLQYQIKAKPDGTQEIVGSLSSGVDPFARLTFGPHTMRVAHLPLDEDGFPTDVAFIEPVVEFTFHASPGGIEATLTGSLRLRVIPVSN
jgi:hypothetical protein